MKNNRLLIILISISALLLIPLIAMQFSTEVIWSLSDFVIMGALLLSVGLAFEFMLKKVTTNKNRIIIGGFILLLFLLIWIELAVGIFGTPFAGS